MSTPHATLIFAACAYAHHVRRAGQDDEADSIVRAVEEIYGNYFTTIGE